MALTQGRQFRLKIAELIRLLEGHLLTKLGSYKGLFEAKLQLWGKIREKVKAQHPEAKWTYNHQMREWEEHPLQRYIKFIELNLPLPNHPETLSLTEWNEYLIWKSENHQGIKDWRRYARRITATKKREDPSKSDNEKQKTPPKGTRAYVPGRKKNGGSLIQIEVFKKKQ